MRADRAGPRLIDAGERGLSANDFRENPGEGMLSESTQSGMSGLAAQVRQVLYARGREARLAGVAAGAAALVVVSVALLLLPSGLSAGILLVVPVVILGWYGGKWAGRCGAGLGAVASVLAGVVPGGVVEGIVVANGAITLAVLALVAEAVPGLRFSSQSYREHAHLDPLTSLGNRRFFRETALVELNRSSRYGRPVSLVYLDVDGYEALRQEAGHTESDLMLVQMASVITGMVRASDVVARISGAEFAVLLPETDGSGAQVVAGKLRDGLGAVVSERGLALNAVVVGASDGPVSLEAMLRQADEAMVDARRAGETARSYRDYVHPPLQLV